MQVSSKLLYKSAILLVGVILVLGVFVAFTSTQKASALDATQWGKVRGYVEDYFGGSQYISDRGGEAGFIKGKLDLADDLNNDSDLDTALASYLDEGDDMATRPILIDNLMQLTTMVPGTEFRCRWSGGTDGGNCFTAASVTMVQELYDAHKAAGFGTDIVDYCQTSNTASPTTGGFGIIAQTGALSSDSDVPVVRELEWSRTGWTNSVPTPFSTSNLIAAPETAGGFSPPAPPTAPDCGSPGPDAELVRCAADWAIRSDGGNVGAGQTDISIISGAGQTVDVRPGSISTLNTGGTNIQAPINTLFSTAGLADLDPLLTTVIICSSQHGGQTAIGLKMLGYSMKGFIHSGIPRWNSTQGEQQVAIGNALPLAAPVEYTAPAKVDTTPPSVTSVTVTNVTPTTADIERVAGEPATLKVEWGTTTAYADGEVNDTVLNADKSPVAGGGNAAQLTGLTPGTTYYYRATSYDGYANGTEVTGSFTTVTCGKPALYLSKGGVYWASSGDYSARILSVDYIVTNSGAAPAYDVTITGSTANSGVTVNSGIPASIGTIGGGGGSGGAVVKYQVGEAGSFWTTNTGTANDACGGSYTYPPET